MIASHAKTVFAVALTAFLTASVPAFAATTAGGGLQVPGVPEIKNVVCLSGCTKVRATTPGGTIQLTGTEMDSTRLVRFAGKTGAVKVKPDLTSSTRVEATVPPQAVTGRVRVATVSGTFSAPSPQTLYVGPAGKVTTGKLSVTDAAISASRTFQFGVRKPTLRYVISGARPSFDLRIDVASKSGEVVRSLFRRDVESGSSQTVTWNGKTTDKKPAPNGAYSYVIRGADGTPASISARISRIRKRAARSKKVADPFSFKIFGYSFPLRGPHSYGDGIGAGRGHQGVDLLADCGTPIVAARGGTVYYNDYQAGGAGNYLVINLRGAGKRSQVYMHMPVRSRFKVGQKVKTGQRIGSVGTTGRSTACHLHFEQWTGPGWYQGGTFMDPLGALKRWDRYS
ncbi:MAG: peptidoglycan DD-metalloendopeptidase family protein [Solirubrobacterales bacterium]|nr:peptidoglycan DD-metalloendopeptidase family protein [Solirubrobacterales bacterium]